MLILPFFTATFIYRLLAIVILITFGGQIAFVPISALIASQVGYHGTVLPLLTLNNLGYHSQLSGTGFAPESGLRHLLITGSGWLRSLPRSGESALRLESVARLHESI